MKRKKNNRLAKRYQSDFINTYKGLDQNLVKAHDIFNNRGRVMSTKGRRDQMEPKLENTFTREVPETIGNKYYGVHPTIQKIGKEYKDKDGKKHVIVQRSEEIEEEEQHLPKVWLPTPKRQAEIKARELKNAPSTLYKLWTSERHQRIVSYNQIVIEKFGDFSLRLLFSGPEWMFVQETSKKRWVSRVYPERDVAMRAYHQSKISWLITEDL